MESRSVGRTTVVTLSVTHPVSILTHWNLIFFKINSTVIYETMPLLINYKLQSMHLPLLFCYNLWKTALIKQLRRAILDMEKSIPRMGVELVTDVVLKYSQEQPVLIYITYWNGALGNIGMNYTTLGFWRKHFQRALIFSLFFVVSWLYLFLCKALFILYFVDFF